MKGEVAEELMLPIFEDEALASSKPSVLARLKSIEWSYSKRGVLEQCPRKYYFGYYGSAVRKARGEPQKARLRALKKLKNRNERAGEILHRVIAHYFRSAGSHRVMDGKGMADWARKMFSADLAFSRRARGELPQPQGEYPPSQLLEFFHGQIDAEELYRETERRLLSALANFAENRSFASVRALRGEPSVRVEKRFRMSSFPCAVSGVVDLAAEWSGTPGVVDWKIGNRSAGEDDSLQLNVYALWGEAEFSSSPEGVQLFKAFLGSSDLVRYHCTPVTLDRAKMRIVQDALRMATVEDYGRHGEMRAFTACAQPRVCALCPFLTICPEGKECVRG